MPLMARISLCKSTWMCCEICNHFVKIIMYICFFNDNNIVHTPHYLYKGPWLVTFLPCSFSSQREEKKKRFSFSTKRIPKSIV